MSASEMMMLDEELNELRTEVEKLRSERDHFREAWAAAQARLDCGVDAADEVKNERATVVAWLRVAPSSRMLTVEETAACIERGEHRKEER